MMINMAAEYTQAAKVLIKAEHKQNKGAKENGEKETNEALLIRCMTVHDKGEFAQHTRGKTNNLVSALARNEAIVRGGIQDLGWTCIRFVTVF